MTAAIPGRSGPVSKQAEQQMRAWAIGLEVLDRVDQGRAVGQLPHQIHPYVTISREVGAGGSEVASGVAAKLGWQMLDKSLLEAIASRFKLPKDMLEFVDETTSNWVHEVFGKWLDSHLVTQSEYVRHLGRIVLMAARHASTVLVGRGAQFLLPHDRGLRVRIVAPLQRRIERVMQVRQVTADEARKHIDEVDAGRRDFVKRYFHNDASDPHLYDLVINTQFFSFGDAADLIADSCRRRFPAS